MKRFYKQAAVGIEDGQGWSVRLDGRPIRTPDRQVLAVPTRPLAAAIADEWNAQGETLAPHDMHMTRTANAAIDRVVPNRTLIEDDLVGFGETDMLCYRVAVPADLAARQHRCWQPLLDWATRRHDSALSVTTGILPQPQPAGALAALRAALVSVDAFGLAGLHGVAAATHSLVLALAVLDGEITAEAACDAALLDETHQTEHWGSDAEAADRRSALRTEITAAARFLRLCQTGPQPSPQPSPQPGQ